MVLPGGGALTLQVPQDLARYYSRPYPTTCPPPSSSMITRTRGLERRAHSPTGRTAATPGRRSNDEVPGHQRRPASTWARPNA
jgi:hypothetical protein